MIQVPNRGLNHLWDENLVQMASGMIIMAYHATCAGEKLLYDVYNV